MTTTGGGHRPADPAALARDGIEAPVRPVLARRGGLRSRAGLVAVGAVAVVVVAAGIGLGGRTPGPSPTPTASGPDGSSVTASRSPRPTRTPGPTELSGFGCIPVDPSDLPEPRFASSAGDVDAIAGLEGPPDWALQSPPTAFWPVPDEGEALTLNRSASIVLVTTVEACIRYAVAEYLAVDQLGGTPTPFAMGEINVNPPRDRVVLGSPPGGDWIVRLVAYYSTGVAGDEDRVVIERFFRVIVTGGPEETPLITPAVACQGAGGPDTELLLMADDGPVTGLSADADRDALHAGASGHVTFPDPIEIRIDGDACATSWRIEVMDENGNTYFEDGQENPRESPQYISQNRFRLGQSPLGTTILRVTVHFGTGVTSIGAWELVVDSPPPPAGAMTAAGGGSAVPRLGCGSGWSLATGEQAFELCMTNLLPDELDVLRAGVDDTVLMTVPGWTITSWTVACGPPSATGEFNWDGSCNLGAWGDGSTDSGPIRFLPAPGRTIVFVWLNAMNERGDTFFGQYFVEIDAEG